MNLSLLFKLLFFASGMGRIAYNTNAKVADCGDLTDDADDTTTLKNTEASTDNVHNVNEISMLQSNQTTSYTLHATFSTRREMGPFTPNEETYFDEALASAYKQSHQTLHKDIDVEADTNLAVVKILHPSRDDREKKEDTTNRRGTPRVLQLSYRYHPYFYRYDYSFFFDFRCNLCGEKSGFWDRRSLRRRDGEEDFVATFEQNLCKGLRDSPYKSFQGVQNCRIHFQ
jgi:hypothetical protein